MKKVILAVLVVVLLVVFSVKDEPTIPNLSVSYEGTTAEVASCGYRLTYRTSFWEETSIIADCAGPEMDAQSLQPLVISAGDEMVLDFDEVIDRYSVLIWGETATLEAPRSKHTVQVPSEAGTYIYVVTAYFGENEATSVLKVIVE